MGTGWTAGRAAAGAGVREARMEMMRSFIVVGSSVYLAAIWLVSSGGFVLEYYVRVDVDELGEIFGGNGFA